MEFALGNPLEAHADFVTVSLELQASLKENIEVSIHINNQHKLMVEI